MPYNIDKLKVWLIGTGPMALDYTRVLQYIGIIPVVIGRGEDSASEFTKQSGVKAHTGGIQKFLSHTEPDTDTFIIIATGTEALYPTLLLFRKFKFARILVEKPAAISINELLANKHELEEVGNQVFVAYNRRFYPSVSAAKKIIQQDGGIQSMHFEFTEWSHRIEPLKKAPGVKENWFFANSTHVIDLAFFLAGEPVEFKSIAKQGTIPWHSNSFFSGAGITEKGVVFSFHANWESAGNWKIELMTSKRKLIFNPLEKLKQVLRGTITEEEIKVDDLPTGVDNLKPGLLEQLNAFLELGGDESALKSLADQIKASEKYLFGIVEG